MLAHPILHHEVGASMVLTAIVSSVHDTRFIVPESSTITEQRQRSEAQTLSVKQVWLNGALVNPTFP